MDFRPKVDRTSTPKGNFYSTLKNSSKFKKTFPLKKKFVNEITSPKVITLKTYCSKENSVLTDPRVKTFKTYPSKENSVLTDPRVKTFKTYPSKENSVVTPHEHLHNKNNTEIHYMMGFKNLGNTCYLNAVLQSLSGLETFVNDLGQLNENDLIAPSSLTLSIWSVISAKYKGNDALIQKSLRDVKKSIEKVDICFVGNKMQDAAEFLGKIIDTMRGESLSVSYPIYKNFQFELLESYKCLGCKEVFFKNEKNFALNVNLPQGRFDNLQSSIKQCMTSDQRELTCKKCGHKTCHVYPSFQQLPRILIVQLKRYKYDNFKKEAIKVSTPVRADKWLQLKPHLASNVIKPPHYVPFPISLSQSKGHKTTLKDLDDDFNKTEPEENGYRYKLISVISHYGQTTSTGHYASDVLNIKENQWIHYDDSKVTEVSENLVFSDDRQTNSYIFFYVHRDIYYQLVNK